jgi:trimeric autotransporter adhesin
LTNDLKAKDSKGNPVTAATGLETFMQQASFYDEAMGQNGKALGIMNPQSNGGPSLVQQVVQQSGQEQNLENVYMDQVVNGNLLNNEIAGGTDLGSAIADYSKAAAAFGTALDPTFVQQNLGTLRQNFLNNVSDAIFNSATPSDLATAFGDSKNNFDPNKATQILQQMQQQDPALFQTCDGQTLTPDKIVNEAKQIYDLVRNGTKVQDAFSKVRSSVTAPTGPVADAYKSGTLHLLSALMGGGVLAAKAAEGAGSPTADASLAASTAQMVGTLTEGVAKWGGSASQTLWTQPGLDSPGVPQSVKDTLKNIESQGKVLGGLGGALSGALGIVAGVGDLKDGNVAAGAVNIGSGVAGALGGVASATEGGAALLSQAGLISSGIVDSIAAGSAALGLFGTVVGVLGALGFEIWQIVEAAENNSKFTGQVLPVLQQYGLTGGPIRPGDLGPSQPVVPHH